MFVPSIKEKEKSKFKLVKKKKSSHIYNIVTREIQNQLSRITSEKSMPIIENQENRIRKFDL